jgi:hypothetical protein
MRRGSRAIRADAHERGRSRRRTGRSGSGLRAIGRREGARGAIATARGWRQREAVQPETSGTHRRGCQRLDPEHARVHLALREHEAVLSEEAGRCLRVGDVHLPNAASRTRAEDVRSYPWKHARSGDTRKPSCKRNARRAPARCLHADDSTLVRRGRGQGVPAMSHSSPRAETCPSVVESTFPV